MNTIRIAIASRNPVKIQAAEQAFEAIFQDANIEALPLSVPSGVRDQPVSDTETRTGARNRVEAARKAEPNADFWVGLEGGVEVIDDCLMAFAWMVVCDACGKFSAARSATLPLPPAVKALVDAGMELGDANDRIFATVNSKQGGGAYGLLTDGRYTREGIYEQTLIIALTPFANPLYAS